MMLRSSPNAGASSSHRRACTIFAKPTSVALRCRAQAEPSVQVNEAPVQTPPQPEAPVPPGCSRYTVSLKKPLGIVLQQDASTKNIYVESVVPDGNAAKNGVSVGDQLIATSGVVYTKEQDYNDVWVKAGQQVVRLLVLGESFKTVSAAIGSHPGHIPVTLEFQKCDTSQAAGK